VEVQLPQPVHKTGDTGTRELNAKNTDSPRSGSWRWAGGASRTICFPALRSRAAGLGKVKEIQGLHDLLIFWQD
jgi:hypothetical protein